MGETRIAISRRQVLLILALCLAATPLACNNMGVAGKYVSETHRNYYLELKADGTFFIQLNDAGLVGSYRTDRSEITINVGIYAAKGKIERKTIVFDGQLFNSTLDPRWTKQ